MNELGSRADAILLFTTALAAVFVEV